MSNIALLREGIFAGVTGASVDTRRTDFGIRLVRRDAGVG